MPAAASVGADRQDVNVAVESLTVTLFNAKRPNAWDEVSDWVDRHGTIANADVVLIARVDTLRASKLLSGWRDQGLLVALPGRGQAQHGLREAQHLRFGAVVIIRSRR